jgi:hypothetical protein
VEEYNMDKKHEEKEKTNNKKYIFLSFTPSLSISDRISVLKVLYVPF